MTRFAHQNRSAIDLNCDLGESFGAWRMGADAQVLPYVSSVNIACGFHAGDANTMRQTLELAARYRVAVGAHTGLPDLVGFGRREMAISARTLYCETLYQIGALAALAKPLGVTLRHVKPHGALYHMLEKDGTLALAYVQAVQDASAGAPLQLVGLAQGGLLAVALSAGVPVRHEMFADRSYLASGLLVPRGQANAVIDDAHAAAQQVLGVLRTGALAALDGTLVKLHADTVCIHGDRANAGEFASALHATLSAQGVTIHSGLAGHAPTSSEPTL
jgi:5-oxoprolinase (ATP-hydrolysing) subunit A